MNDKEDALSPENALPVLVIQLSRVYDVLVTLLRVQNPELAKMIVSEHAQGKLLSPPPRFIMEEDDDNISN